MLVIGLNQTIDRTIRLGKLEPGTVMRSSEVAVTGGGKAVNVARCALVLNHPCLLVGPFPGRMGREAMRLIGQEGLAVEPLDLVDGEIRGTTIVLEPDRATVINETGPPMRDNAWPTALDALDRLLSSTFSTPSTSPTSVSDRSKSKGPNWLVVSGSVPPGTPATAHADLITLAHDHGWKVAVDVTGDLLLDAADRRADLLSPNLAEATAALGDGAGPDEGGEAVDPDGPNVAEDALSAARRLVERGAGAALVSAGRHGVAAADRNSERFVVAPTVEVVNPIGAGDSLLSATIVALENDRPLFEAVAAGVAYAAASVADPVGGYADVELHRRLSQELG